MNKQALPPYALQTGWMEVIVEDKCKTCLNNARLGFENVYPLCIATGEKIEADVWLCENYESLDGLVGSTEPFTQTLLEFTAKNDCTKVWYQAVIDWVRRDVKELSK